MRVIGVVIAALMTLGLAAFGVVAAQKAAGPSSLIALAAHVVSPSQNTAAAAHPAASNQVAQVRVAQTPVVQTQPTPALQTNTAPAAPTVLAQNNAAPAPTAPAAPAASTNTANPPPAPKTATCSNPDGLGISRVVEIDTTGGPAFGTEHFKQYDFLRDKEVVLTFDDGPWPENTPMVLKALQDNCIKATFFEIGEHASWHPEITKQVIDAGMTVGTHTWSHKDLARNPYAKDIEQAKQEIEMGVSAVHMAAGGGPIAPFFRFPYLQQPPELVTYLGTRNIATFSTDIDSGDFRMHKPEQVINSVMSQLEKRGKGIVLLHDFHRNTAEALPELLRQLKLAGYKVVHVVPKEQLTTVPKYDEMFEHRENLSSSAQPASATAPANVAAAHHRGSMYMYVPGRE
jgi:peptidoglycan/xylan/chitin deacetylase (PgdA/CDA1 family)